MAPFRFCTRSFRVGVLVALSLLGFIPCGCGGGASYSFGVNPTSVSLTAERYDLFFPALQSIRTPYKEDWIVVGYPVGLPHVPG